MSSEFDDIMSQLGDDILPGITSDNEYYEVELDDLVSTMVRLSLEYNMLGYSGRDIDCDDVCNRLESHGLTNFLQDGARIAITSTIDASVACWTDDEDLPDQVLALDKGVIIHGDWDEISVETWNSKQQYKECDVAEPCINLTNVEIIDKPSGRIVTILDPISKLVVPVAHKDIVVSNLVPVSSLL